MVTTEAEEAGVAEVAIGRMKVVTMDLLPAVVGVEVRLIAAY